MLLNESGILLKNHVSCNLYWNITSQFHPTIYENFKAVFYLSGANENLESCVQVRFEQLKYSKQLCGTFTGEYLSKWTLSQKIQNIMLAEKYNFYRTVICNKTATRKC